MHSLFVLLKKEWTEQVKDYRIVWLPIVFIGVAIMHPLTMKLLPTLIGQNTQGIMLDPNAKVSSGNEIFAGVFGQVNQFGFLILGITLMGTIVKEKQNGILDILFSKPVNTGSYLMSKWLMNSLIIAPSIAIGLYAGLYYTNVYYHAVDMARFTQALLFYEMWMMFIVFLGVMASAVVKTQIQAATITILIPTVMLILGNVNNVFFELFLPSTLSKNATTIMMGGELTHTWFWNILLTIVITMSVYSCAYIRMRYKRRD